jgi:hypothetical protein
VRRRKKEYKEFKEYEERREGGPVPPEAEGMRVKPE